MKVVKRLLYFRHAHKAGPHISEEGKVTSRAIILSEEITDGFFGPMERTRETINEILEGNGIHPVLHPPIEEIGRQALEKEMGTQQFIDKVKSGFTNLEAVDQVFSRYQAKAWEEEFARGVSKMFESMTGDLAVAVGHDPFIPLAARYYGCSDARSIRELEYVQFVLYEDGSIRPLR